MKLELLVTMDRRDNTRYNFVRENGQLLLVRHRTDTDIPVCIAACTSPESGQAALRLMLL